VTDIGIIMFRRMLEEQMVVVSDGGEPINIHRTDDPNAPIVLPCEYYQYPGYEELGGPFKEYKPGKPDVEAVLSGDGVSREEWANVEAKPRSYGGGGGDGHWTRKR
jgi:hypothetical protein